MNSVIETLESQRIIPVVTINNPSQATKLAPAILAGGLSSIEITFRTKAAADSMSIINEHYPEMLIGAGTLLNEKQVDSAIDAGAKFIISPGISDKVILR